MITAELCSQKNHHKLNAENISKCLASTNVTENIYIYLSIYLLEVSNRSM